MQGCVPVIDHRGWSQLPFARLLNYSRFAIRMDRRNSIVQLLRALDTDDYTAKREGVTSAKRWFDYARVREWVSPYTLIRHEIGAKWTR